MTVVYPFPFNGLPMHVNWHPKMSRWRPLKVCWTETCALASPVRQTLNYLPNQMTRALRELITSYDCHANVSKTNTKKLKHMCLAVAGGQFASTVCHLVAVCACVAEARGHQEEQRNYHLKPMSSHTHTHATQDTLQHMHYTLFEGWVLVMQIPLGEKWSQSESRWEVRPGVQALHLSSVIKTGTLGCSHPIEEKKAGEGMRARECRPRHAPARLRELRSVTHTSPLSHLYLSLKCIVTRSSLQLSPPLLESVTLTSLKVTSDTLWDPS